MELSFPVTLFDTLIALCFIISGLIGLLLFSLIIKKRPKPTKLSINNGFIELPIVNGLSGQRVSGGTILLLHNGDLFKRFSLANSVRIKLPYPTAGYNEVRFICPGFQVQSWQVEKLPESVQLIPLSPYVSQRLNRLLIRWLRGIEIGLLLTGTLFIPLSSVSVMIIFLLASISLWILHLKRLSAPRLPVRVVDAKTGLGVKYASVILHRSGSSQHIISDRQGQIWMDLPLPTSFSVGCRNYYPIKDEILPATSVASSGICIPLYPEDISRS